MADALAIYVHWPYCARICPYCDFNVYKGEQNNALLAAILKDLDHWRNGSGKRDVTSIHFGGGTPSLMSAANVAAVIDRVNKLWGLNQTIEIGLEANPSDADEQKWRAFEQAGINRLSIGVQSFQDDALKFLGRDHSAMQARNAVSLAAEIFPNLSLDLIFGWAGQTLDGLETDIETALGLGLQHLSTYQLTIEEGTAFERAERRGLERAVDNDLSADMYNLVVSRLLQEKFEHYEVSNFARPGYRSRHNLAYWRGYDYVGVGPGAHGRLIDKGAKQATSTYLTPEDYMHHIAEHGSGVSERVVLSPQERATEYIMMGLRISEGISLGKYAEISGEKMSAQKLSSLAEEGLVVIENNRLKVTPTGRPLLDYITARLLT